MTVQLIESFFFLLRMATGRAGVRGVLSIPGNPIYLPEGGKATDLPVFEIRAAHRSRTISFFLGEMLGRGRRSPPAGEVVEAGGLRVRVPGVRVRGSGSMSGGPRKGRSGRRTTDGEEGGPGGGVGGGGGRWGSAWRRGS
jgi:hypothetical protein